MLKWIMAGALIGWAGIVSLAWWLANLRIAVCHYEAGCNLRATAARDHVLTNGLTVALISALGAAVAWSAIRARTSGHLAPRRIGVLPSLSRRLPRSGLRVALAAGFAVCLAAALLWWSGMIRPETIGWQSSLPTNAYVNPYENLVDENLMAENMMAGDLSAADGARAPRITPVNGDPFVDRPNVELPDDQDTTPANAAINIGETSDPLSPEPGVDE